MHIPSISADSLAVLALACAALAVLASWPRRSSQTIFNGGILLAIGLAIASALPFLSHLPWADLVDEASIQAIAALHFLEVTYTILTL
ncbi:hypothetical protein PMI42_05723 [Bradyrhizobium sp. YR681]|uniref:hypothetical protein n=1 Tax=Bradyrhizobium sp. YR681 TaxID=1144344 RepID=UPI0002714968|nr:hypothetical protein [Bradyrhizobium sp. YR681]EJN10953.1 hypothetical protein PMI42_05723 [Bradyrhizobium sp. YR681]